MDTIEGRDVRLTLVRGRTTASRPGVNRRGDSYTFQASYAGSQELAELPARGTRGGLGARGKAGVQFLPPVIGLRFVDAIMGADVCLTDERGGHHFLTEQGRR